MYYNNGADHEFSIVMMNSYIQNALNIYLVILHEV